MKASKIIINDNINIILNILTLTSTRIPEIKPNTSEKEYQNKYNMYKMKYLTLKKKLNKTN